MLYRKMCIILRYTRCMHAHKPRVRGAHVVDCVGASAYFSHMSCTDVMRLHCLDGISKIKRAMEEVVNLSCLEHSSQSAKIEGAR